MPPATPSTAVAAPPRDGSLLLEAGRVLADQFEVVRHLGRGGMGVVYEVINRLTGERLALKTILPIHLSHRNAVERFVREITTAPQLQHPNVVAVYGLGQHA